MEVRNGGDAPRLTGQGVCGEAAFIADEMDDDDFYDLQGELDGSGRVYSRRGAWRSVPRARSLDSGLS